MPYCWKVIFVYNLNMKQQQNYTTLTFRSWLILRNNFWYQYLLTNLQKICHVWLVDDPYHCAKFGTNTATESFCANGWNMTKINFISIQCVALMRRNTTGAPWSVGRPHVQRPAAHPPAVLQTTMTDASKQNNTGPLRAPLINFSWNNSTNFDSWCLAAESRKDVPFGGYEN